MNCNLTTDNNDYVRGYKDGKTATTIAAVDILKEAYEEHLKEKQWLIEKYPGSADAIEKSVKPWVNKAKIFLESIK